MSGGEIILIFLFIIMFFGAKKVPEIARGMGRMLREVKDASNEIKREIKEGTDSVNKDFDQEK
ncbi:MAG: twin-arginine translocase TatA/TatE family subunit [Flavobacteriales bacterium]|nr:twin-arginine translocase TatA/TatE family subunit [Flavobacteriales bacterium]|tara:strand:+ start:252 stop:440 length:189 start_codon:yes stop_codon:yes gene_type:complete